MATTKQTPNYKVTVTQIYRYGRRRRKYLLKANNSTDRLISPASYEVAPRRKIWTSEFIGDKNATNKFN